MISRFQILLPYRIFIPANLQEQVAPLEVNIGDLAARIYVPHRSSLEIGDASGESDIPPNEVLMRLNPAELQTPAPGVTIDGIPALLGDVLQIDFHKESFDRGSSADDPPIDLAFSLVNSFLMRLRAVSGCGWIKPLGKEDDPWMMTYLDDDGAPVTTRIPGSASARFSLVWRIQYVSIAPIVWSAIAKLPAEYEPQSSDELILDSQALLPQIGPSIVLAFVAIETRISQALNILASLANINSDLWAWINDRNDFTKEPSTSEQLDTVVKALIGKSLKEDAKLWEGFQNLRKARNTFVHEGRASIGGKPVTQARAGQLVQAADQIIKWIENLLPQDERRPRLESSAITQIAKIMIAVPAEETPGMRTEG